MTTRNIFHQKAAVLGPHPCAWAAKLERKTKCPTDAAEVTGKEPEVVSPNIMNGDSIFKLSGEPLYGGKGKRRCLNSKECDTIVTCPYIEEASDSNPNAQC